MALHATPTNSYKCVKNREEPLLTIMGYSGQENEIGEKLSQKRTYAVYTD